MQLPVLIGLLDELPIGVILLDRTGTVVHFNRYEERLARRQREKVVGRKFFEQVAPCMNVQELAGTFFERIGREPLSERVEFSFPFPFLDQPRDVVVHLASFDVGGETFGCLFVEDVSAQRSVERTRETLGSLLVHDLKNPLAVVHSNLGFLESVVDSPHATEAVEDALRATERLQRMLLDLLDVTRLETSAMPLRRRPLDLCEVARTIANEAKALGRLRGITIETQLPCEPVIVTADEDVLRRAIDNLVENAARHARSRVIVRAQGAPASLEVADDGPGIPEAIRAGIFEKWVQVHTEEQRGHNRGLGLTFVRLAAQAHGGTASVECPPEGGTVFRFAFA